MIDTETKPFYILSLDGGGSLGVYTIGVLKELEDLVKTQIDKPLHEQFGLIYGTSTGSIIASLIALGRSIDEIRKLYYKYIPHIMNQDTSKAKSLALRNCATNDEIFGSKKFNDETLVTLLGVVATRYAPSPRPMIFKSSGELAHRGRASFVPGFGCTIADAVIASCSATPFFDSHKIITKDKNGQDLSHVELIDGGFVANNPTLFAITDAVQALKKSEKDIRVLSIGVGNYPRKSTGFKESGVRIVSSIMGDPLALFETTIAANNNAIEELRKIIFRELSDFERVNSSQTNKNYETNFLESDLKKLSLIQECGRESFREKEDNITKLLFSES